MKVRRFTAPTAAQGLARIRAELGAEAVVISSRETPEGVEFLAAPYPALETSAESAVTRGMGERIVSELAGLRGLIRDQLAGFAWGALRRRDPHRVAALHTLLLAGISPQLARTLGQSLPPGLDDNQARQWLRSVLIRNLPVHSGGVTALPAGRHALVGPTGAGKTTTLAKFAAQLVKHQGADAVRLISLDAWRVGARDQLAEWALRLGVEHIVIEDMARLSPTLSGLRPRVFELFDVPGLGFRDTRVAQQAAALTACGVARWLVLPAAFQGEVLESIIQAYRLPALAGVVLSKLDESLHPGAVLDCAIRHRLRVLAMSHGQRVPEDLLPAKAALLVDMCLRARQTPAFALQEDDWPVRHGEAFREQDHG
jgi:flagellar biosynthesis protein FlhF